jgi:hypothetical protein
VCRTLAATGRRFNVGVLPVFEIKNGGEISLAAVRVPSTDFSRCID